MSGREIVLVLCTGGGDLLGVLAPFEVADSGWNRTLDVVRGARARFGVDVVVLRLLRAAGGWGKHDGGTVTYLAELTGDLPAGVSTSPYDGDDPLTDHPLRLPYARPGGPAADIRWAAEALAERGIKLTGPPEQLRTWNLSSIWTLPTTIGRVWLKANPPFLAQEATILPLLDPAVVPTVLAAEAGGRVLLAELPGEDQWEARGAPLAEMVGVLVRLQHEWCGRVPELLTAGLPDYREPVLVPAVQNVVRRHAEQLTEVERGVLDGLVADLPARFEALTECELPDTLVHGDFHVGNVRGEPGAFRILDWSGCGVGHPMLDRYAFIEDHPPGNASIIDEAFRHHWLQAVPSADFARVADLCKPIGVLQAAVVYQTFLDAIEPDERVYHAGDPVAVLKFAAEESSSRSE